MLNFKKYRLDQSFEKLAHLTIRKIVFDVFYKPRNFENGKSGLFICVMQIWR